MTQPSLYEVKLAAKLLSKALQPNLVVAKDTEYRNLLHKYQFNREFRALVDVLASGLDLRVLDGSGNCLVVAANSADSRFALRVHDLRSSSMKPEEKAAFLVAHLAVASAFFPTAVGLDDDTYTPPPVTVGNCRDILLQLVRTHAEGTSMPAEVELAWAYLNSLPVMIPNAQRAAPNSVTGLVRMVLESFLKYNMVRLEREASVEADLTYTATHRLRVQLRDSALLNIYETSKLA